MNLLIYSIISLCLLIWVWKNQKYFTLDGRSLQKQWLFRLAIIFPLASSLYFMIWLGWAHPFRFDAEGYNTFLEINKFSLGILALSPILGAFVVYAHRSIQSEIQINTSEKQLYEAQKKNKVDMYYSRRKFIHEQLENIDKGFNYGLKNTNEIYNLAFLVGDDYTDEINVTFFNYIDTKLEHISSIIEVIIDSNDCIGEAGSVDEQFKKTITESIRSIGTLVHLIERTLVSKPAPVNTGELENIHSKFALSYSYYKSTNEDEFNILVLKKKNIYNIRELLTELSKTCQLLHKTIACMLSNKEISIYLPSINKLEQMISDSIFGNLLGD